MSAPSYAREREEFLLLMQAEGMAPEIARRILRHANTVQRLSAAECNGDYPCDNGERKVEWCARCEAGYVRSSMVPDRQAPLVGGEGPRNGKHPLICPNCHAQDLIAQWCAKAQTFIDQEGGHHPRAIDAITASGGDVTKARIGLFVPVFQGDPRGACVKLRVPSGKTDDVAREGICVPSRSY